MITTNPPALKRKPALFRITYKDKNGLILNGTVKQVSEEDYEVLILEKGVIVHCLKDEDGKLVCNLNSRRNIPWIEGISSAINRELCKAG